MIEQYTLEKSLQQHFGYSEFRIGQKEIIEEVMKGNDVLGVLPTGSGKSLCYQLPAKLLTGTTIVVSPLISLMIDQVNQLRANQFKSVVALNSFMDPNERRQVYRKLYDYDLIYVSPELLQQEELIMLLENINVCLFVIDEAHCISQWGHEFRPDYLKLSTIIRKFNNPAIMALSATATKDVQNDIVHYLERPNMVKHIFPIDRENIIFSVKQINDDQEKIKLLVKLFSRYTFPALIYFSSRQSAEVTANLLQGKLPDQRIAFYHGGMDQMDRIAVQQQFMNGQLDIICCTSAFGMGINKSNIRLIVHFHLPSQLESYIQEVGRAGRDGNPSLALLLYTETDAFLPKGLIKKELPSINQLSFVFQQLKQLYENGQALNGNSLELAEMFQLSEIQWRFLHNQLEKHGMIVKNQIVYHRERWRQGFAAIRDYIEERVLFKDRKLAEMIGWAEEENCLREYLYQHFQDSFKRPADKCCSNCGFSLSILEPAHVPHVKRINLSWQEKLRNLLIAGDDNGKPT
ncbi:ATP-dependent DNA helicase RecQ [Lentibacillus populi]|uniref:ATP-dependent DNA helicase RecQ n=1 Tax=Lentibacillus populi TaxID=1827502 RepID=A0A9W5TV55_9BACI|nr:MULTISPECIES: RecQ family ATP-dependent DNA helicase [Bacillaceae]MBT2214296.1 RecQ family ATP-dependent DNA helicase [Virgibacillus dakarensis]GGB33722.1 ATP-dependent DNA helicase RecQ [Lentibacillus populi]